MLWLGFAAMLLAALGFLGAVFFNKKLEHLDEMDSAEVVRQSNISSFRNRQTELDGQLASGDIDKLQYQGLLVEAQRSLLDDVAVEPSSNPSSSGRWLLTSSGVLVIALASVLYYYLGAAADLDIRNDLEEGDYTNTAALAEKIRLRLERQPENLYYRMLLARFYQQDGQLQLSQQAYKAALLLSPDDLTIRAEYAQALFLAADSVITDEVAAQIDRILRVDNNHPSALGLRGIGAFAVGNYRAALADWNQALNFLPRNSEAANAMRAGITAARAKIAAARTGVDSVEQTGESSGQRIKVRVSLTEKLQAAPETLLFVYVREWEGSPMPMMARRVTVADLPLEIEFSNDQALMPGRDFSTVPKFEVVARVSHAGTPISASGDFEGRYGPIELQGDGEVDASGEIPAFSFMIDHRLP